MSEDVFLCSPFAKAITTLPLPCGTGVRIFDVLPRSNGFGEVCSALRPHASFRSPAAERRLKCFRGKGWGKGSFPNPPQGLEQTRAIAQGEGRAVPLLPGKDVPKDPSLPPVSPAAEARGRGYPVTDTTEQVLADLRLFTWCEAGSDCCSHLPSSHSRQLGTGQGRQPSSYLLVLAKKTQKGFGETVGLEAGSTLPPFRSWQQWWVRRAVPRQHRAGWSRGLSSCSAGSRGGRSPCPASPSPWLGGLTLEVMTSLVRARSLLTCVSAMSARSSASSSSCCTLRYFTRLELACCSCMGRGGCVGHSRGQAVSSLWQLMVLFPCGHPRLPPGRAALSSTPRGELDGDRHLPPPQTGVCSSWPCSAACRSGPAFVSGSSCLPQPARALAPLEEPTRPPQLRLWLPIQESQWCQSPSRTESINQPHHQPRVPWSPST